VLGGALALLIGATDLPGKTPLGLRSCCAAVPSQVTADRLDRSPGTAKPRALAGWGLAPTAGAPHPLYGFRRHQLSPGLEHAPLVFLALRAGLRALPGEAIEAAEGAAPSGCASSHIVLPMTLPSLVRDRRSAFVSGSAISRRRRLLGIPGRYSVLTVLITSARRLRAAGDPAR